MASFPHRVFQLRATDPALFGKPSSPTRAATDVRDAHAHLERLHATPCEFGKTKILFRRLPVAGVSHDINSLVRSLAVAVRDRRQLVLLPPSAANRVRLRHVAGKLHEHRPWHWLPEGVPLSSLLRLSSCQRAVQHAHPGLLDALGNSTDATAIVCRGRSMCEQGVMKDHDVTQKWYVEIRVESMPTRFRRNGLLWWFQVLTTFFVNISGKLATSIRSHVAMQPFLRTELRADRSGTGESAHARVRVARLNWAPTARFELGMHVRMGDACGERADTHGLRVCLRSLHANIRRLHKNNITGGTIFLASDSQKIVDQAALVNRKFHIHALPLRRTQYELSGRIEHSLRHGEDLQAVRDVLMDLLLLSRAQRIVGTMASNIPRLALQFRVTTPGNRSAYLALDENEWCTCSSCKPYFVLGKRSGTGKEQLVGVGNRVDARRRI